MMEAVRMWIRANALTLLMNIAIAAAVVVAGWLIIKMMRRLLEAALLKTKLSGIMQTFTVNVLEKLAWAFVIIMALERLGVNVAPLIAGLGVTGFIVGFAFQDSMSNFAAGMMIALNRPFNVGDFVSVAGQDGTVKELNMMATTLATPDNKKLVIPNKVVWGTTIVNFNALGTRRVEMTVGVAYGTDLIKAKTAALEVVKGLKGVLENPAPMAEVSSLDDSAVTIRVRAWVKSADYWNVYYASLPAIVAAYEKNGITIPFPQIDVHMVGA